MEVSRLLGQCSFQSASLVDYRPVMGWRRTPGFLLWSSPPPSPREGSFINAGFGTSEVMAAGIVRHAESISGCSSPLMSEVGASEKLVWPPQLPQA